MGDADNEFSAQGTATPTYAVEQEYSCEQDLSFAESMISANGMEDLLSIARAIGCVPSYNTVRAGGPDHLPIFRTVVTLLPCGLQARAVGSSKILSRRAAATKLLYNVDPDDPESCLPEPSNSQTTFQRLYAIPSHGDHQIGALDGVETSPSGKSEPEMETHFTKDENTALDEGDKYFKK